MTFPAVTHTQLEERDAAEEAEEGEDGEGVSGEEEDETEADEVTGARWSVGVHSRASETRLVKMCLRFVCGESENVQTLSIISKQQMPIGGAEGTEGARMASGQSHPSEQSRRWGAGGKVGRAGNMRTNLQSKRDLKMRIWCRCAPPLCAPLRTSALPVRPHGMVRMGRLIESLLISGS